MKVAVKIVEDIVREASEKMSQPSYSQVLVGGFVQDQPTVIKYVTAHAEEMGGADAVVNCIFHAALLALCLQRQNNRSVRTLGFEELDHASEGDRVERIEKLQPALGEYILTNVEGEEMQRVLMLIVLAMDWAN